MELDRLALEAERGTEKSRPTTMAESVQHEVEAAIRWVSEVSTDSRRALVLATNPKGEMVVTMMRASGPSAAANYSYSFTLSKMEVRTIKQFLGLEIGEEVANVSTG